MDIRTPKHPVSSMREFLKEVGIIVLGVLGDGAPQSHPVRNVIHSSAICLPITTPRAEAERVGHAPLGDPR